MTVRAIEGAVPSHYERKNSAADTIKGVALGALAHYTTQMTGIKVALHEVIGHGCLGFHLTTDFRPGQEPKYVIYPFERIKELFHAGNFEEFKQTLWKLLKGPFNGDVKGYTSAGWGKPNALFDSLDKRAAWISITGSIPGLALNSLTVAAGVKLKEKKGVLGTALLAYGLMEHFLESTYPLSAAFMNQQELTSHASHGHDFANFAIKVADFTGISSQTIAIGTAVAWTAFVPAVALGMHLYLKSQNIRVISGKELTKMEKGLKIASMVGGALTCVAKVAKIFADTIFPNLAPVSTVLSHSTPLLSGVAVITNGYETYQDLKSTIPVSAKVISVAKLVISVASSVALVVGIFIPGINSIIIVGVLLGSAGTIILGFVKYRILKDAFPKTQSINATEVMEGSEV